MNGVLSLCVAMLATAAQLSIVTPQNLLTNSAAEYGLDSWLVEGDVTVEEFNGNRCFVVRNGGQLMQEVELPRSTTSGFLSSRAMGPPVGLIPIPGSPSTVTVRSHENSRRSSDSWVQPR